MIFSFLQGGNRQAVIGCLSLLFLVFGCSRSANQDAAGTEASSENISSGPPFTTREPERYRATRTVLINQTANGVTTTKKTVTSVARDGSKRWEEYQSDDGRKLIFLENDDGKFVLDPSAKTYRDLHDSPAGESASEVLSAAEMFADTSAKSSYQRLGNEEVEKRSTVKYQSKTPGSATETLIWFDENLGMVLRSESRSNSQGSTIEVIMTLKDVSLEVDERLFRLPDDFKRVSGSKPDE